MRISGFLLIFLAIAVFSAHLSEGIQIPGSLRKEKKTLKPSLITKENSPFFARQKNRIFLFFLWGDLVQDGPQNPAPASCLFSTRKSRPEVPERGDFGEENCLGKGGADRAKKGKKDAQKKVGKCLTRYHCGRNLKHFGLKYEVGEECWQFWAWVLGVNFFFWGGGVLKPWRNKAENFAGKIRHQNSLRNSLAVFLKFARP